MFSFNSHFKTLIFEASTILILPEFEHLVFQIQKIHDILNFRKITRTQTLHNSGTLVNLEISPEKIISLLGYGSL